MRDDAYDTQALHSVGVWMETNTARSYYGACIHGVSFLSSRAMYPWRTSLSLLLSSNPIDAKKIYSGTKSVAPRGLRLLTHWV